MVADPHFISHFPFPPFFSHYSLTPLFAIDLSIGRSIIKYMKEDFAELVEYLDEKFSNIDRQLENLKENKADKSDMNILFNAVDAYAQKADAFFQELVMLSHQINRHEKWLHQIAEKLGIKLEY